MKYNYSVSTNTLWASFDFGHVEADSIEEARDKAIEKLEYDFSKANTVLDQADITKGFTIEFDINSVVVTKSAE